MKTVNRIEQIASIAAVVLLVGGCFVVLRPFVSSLLWAAVVCYSTWPCYIWLETKLKGRRDLAALLMTLLVALVLVGPFLAVGLTLAENLARISLVIQGIVRDGLPTPPAWVERLPLIGGMAERFWQEWSGNSDKVMDSLHLAFRNSRGWVLQRGLDLGQGILQMSLSVLITFFFYRDGERVVVKIAAGAKRIIGDQTQHLLLIVGRTIDGVVYGILGTALAQGILAGFGFWLANVPSPLLLGLLTFLLALVPLGPPLIWIPAAIWLFYHSSTGWAVFMAVYGVLIISGIDNVLRPYLISRGSKLPFVLVFLGAIGGVIAFGFIGLFLGPTLLAVAYCLIDEWSKAGASSQAVDVNAGDVPAVSAKQPGPPSPPAA